MAFKLYKGPGDCQVIPTERFVASGAVTVGMPVKLAAGASGAELGKVAVIAGASSSADSMYGVPIHSAVDTAEVLVIPFLPGSVWEVDAAADTNVTSVAADNYLATTTLLLTVGASTVLGKKCHIIGVKGAAADRKYLVRANNVVGV